MQTNPSPHPLSPQERHKLLVEREQLAARLREVDEKLARMGLTFPDSARPPAYRPIETGNPPRMNEHIPAYRVSGYSQAVTRKAA